MADELLTPAPAPRLPAVVSMRLTPERAARFVAVLNYRIAKSKSKDAAHFLWQMFEYIEKNPYCDFPTGK